MSLSFSLGLKAVAGGLFLLVVRGIQSKRRQRCSSTKTTGEGGKKASSSSLSCSSIHPRDLVVVLERCIDPRNFEYILRTCLALKVEDVWVIDATKRKIPSGKNPFDRSSLAEFTEEEGGGVKKKEKRQVHGLDQETDHGEEAVTLLLDGTARVLLEKLRVSHFSSSKDFLDESARRGLDVWATELSQVAIPLAQAMEKRSRRRSQIESQIESQHKVALVFGREGDGVSEEVLLGASERVYFPLHGFSDSLNVSASVAIILDSIVGGSASTPSS